MSLLNGLSAGLTALSQGVAANNDGKEQGNALLRQIYAKRQEEELKAAQTANTWRQARQLQLGDPGYGAAKGEEAGAIEGGKTPALVDREKLILPVRTAGEVAKQTALIPGKVQEQKALTPGLVQRAGQTAMAEVPAKVLTAKQTADYAAPVGAVDPKTGETKFYTRSEALGLKKPAAGGGVGGAQSAQAQGVQARLLAAVSEARAASKRMDEYENKMLADPIHATPGMLTQLGGKLGTRLAGQHSLTSIAAETAGEAVTDPNYLQYVRDAGLMARATQMMSSRGGSEAMVSAEQLLNRAVPNANGLKGSVDAARKSRNAIFGPHGGLMQALSPEQIAKVEKGLAALDAGETNSPAYRDAAAVIESARHAPQGHANTGTKSPAQQLWDAAVAKHGEAKVVQEYGPRPDDE